MTTRRLPAFVFLALVALTSVGCDDDTLPNRGDDLPRALCEPPTDNACEACACANCRAETDACKDLPGTAQGGPATGRARSVICQELVRCVQTSHCFTVECLCGNQRSPEACADAPSGPCREEYLAAFEIDTIEPEQLGEAPPAAVAAATLQQCQFDRCRSSCLPPKLSEP